MPRRLQLPLSHRGFIGHADSLGQGFAEVAAELARHPALDPLSWGSAYADDPWPRPLPAELPAATWNLLHQHYTRQSPEEPRSLTFVTRWSRSLVTLEDHAGALVLSVAYVSAAEDASAHAAAASAVPPDDGEPNELALAPTPADVRWALRGRAFATAPALLERLRAAVGPESAGDPARVTALLGLAAVYGDDLRLLETLRWIARLTPGDWALRAAAIAIAERRGYALLLHELCAGESDPELHAELVALTTPTPATDPEPESAA